MSHIPGHWDDGSVGASRNVSSMGVLSLADYPDMKIIFINNRGTRPEELEDGKVGFHLHITPRGPEAGKPADGRNLFGVAYDVIPWKRHEIEHEAEHFFGKEIWNDSISDEALRNWANKTYPDDLDNRMVVEQIIDYRKTPSFNLLYRQNDPDKIQTFIKKNVKNYSDIKPLESSVGSKSRVKEALLVIGAFLVGILSVLFFIK